MLPSGLREPVEVLASVQTRLGSWWPEGVLGEAPWRVSFPLGASKFTTSAQVQAAWSDLHRDTVTWRDWVAAAGAGVGLQERSVTYARGSRQEIAASLEVATAADAARLCGPDWEARLERATRHADMLRRAFCDRSGLAHVLRRVDGWRDVDVDLLIRTSRWFAAPHPTGLTARQVPVEGLGTKWLAGRESLVRRLAGLDDLGLVPGRPSRVHLTYLDPDHLARGGRRHDVATVGDVDSLAYRPEVVLISENRDTAQGFGPVAAGIAVEGDGNGPGAVPDLAWVQQASRVVYWGDMDGKGLEILASYRARIPGLVSILMDLDDYRRWESYGVDQDHAGKPLGPHPAASGASLGHLEPGERRLYEALCDPAWPGARRIEQERIPLEVAWRLVTA